MAKTYNLKNRSAGMAGYKIPELNIKREIAPGQTIKITDTELEKLLFQDGGRTLVEEYLQILSDDAIKNFSIKAEVEYNMSESDVVELIKNGSLDEFLDALEFAPSGVIDLIKAFAVSLPMTDTDKRDAVKEILGFDVDAAIRHEKEDADEAKENNPSAEKPKTRRASNSTQKTRRTSTKKTTEE